MRVLLFGGTGRLGSQIVSANALFGFELLYPNSKQLNIADPFLASKLNQINPDLIINAAAFTNVDDAETHIEQAYRLNKDAPRFIAQTCKDLNIPVIHISTDYVFSGNKKSPYLEEDQPDPINIYGKSKLDGDLAISNSCEKHITSIGEKI